MSDEKNIRKEKKLQCDNKNMKENNSQNDHIFTK